MDGPAFSADPPSDRRAPSTSGSAPGGEAARPARDGFRPFGKDGFSFRDLLDIINPLQHIPVVSTIYRRVSGDALDALPRLAGGSLFGGIAGAVSAVVNLVVKDASGKDIGENALAFLGLGDDPVNAPAAPDPAAMLALAEPKPAFSAGWQAATAMQYCDAECLDPKRSFFTDATAMAAMSTASLLSAASEGDQAAAAARYAEATGLAAIGGRRLDMRG